MVHGDSASIWKCEALSVLLRVTWATQEEVVSVQNVNAVKWTPRGPDTLVCALLCQFFPSPFDRGICTGSNSSCKGETWFQQWWVFFCWDIGWKSKDLLLAELFKTLPLKDKVRGNWSRVLSVQSGAVGGVSAGAQWIAGSSTHGEWPPSCSGILTHHIKMKGLWFRKRLGVLLIIQNPGFELSLAKTLMLMWALFSSGWVQARSREQHPASPWKRWGNISWGRFRLSIKI